MKDLHFWIWYAIGCIVGAIIVVTFRLVIAR